MPNKPIEYITQIDGGNNPSVDTDWTVQSPDTTNWAPSVTTAGILSFSSGGSALNTPKVPGWDGTGWDISISNGGVVSITSSSFLTGSDLIAGVVDSNSVQWNLIVNELNELQLTTDPVVDETQYYPSIVYSFIATAGTDRFELHAIKPVTTVYRS